MVGVVGLLLFVVLGTALVLLWRWAYDVARSSGPVSRSEDMDGHRHNGG